MPRGGLADPNFRRTPTGQRALRQRQGGGAPAGGGATIPIFNPGAAGAGAGAGSSATGDPRVVTALGPAEIKQMQANAAAQLAAGLTGPFTPEAEQSGYASLVAQFYGVNHPNAQKWVKTAMARNWDATTFSRWLRSRPGFTRTEVGMRMKADVLAVIAQVFGRIT